MSTTRGRAAYFAAAREILAADGADGLTQAAICARLPVTTGAFYHHFANMGEFVAAFAETRKAFYLAAFDDIARDADAVRRLERLTGTFFAMHHRSEAAYRAWGNSNDVVRATVTAIDTGGEAVMAGALAELLGDRARAELLADMALSLAIGMQSRDRPVDVDRLVALTVEWFRCCLGFDAEIVLEDGTPGLRLRPSAA